MRKLFGLICVLILLSSFTTAQFVSDPAVVDISVDNQAGITLVIDVSALTYTLAPPTRDENMTYSPSNEGLITMDFSWRLAVGSTAQLYCDSSAIVGPDSATPEAFLWHTFAGDFVWDSALPAVGVPQDIFTGTGPVGTRNVTIDVLFLNNLALDPGVYTTSITYTVIEI